MQLGAISMVIGLGGLVSLGAQQQARSAGDSAGEAIQANETDDKILGSKVTIAINSEKGMTDGTYSVKTTAKDGVVTLEGKMPTDVRKTRCGEIAKGVAGVKSVVNNIAVPPADKSGGK
jgi:hyperosmotically inducible periplasmic protein